VNKEEDEAELGLVEDISNIIRQLEGQIVWMQKIQHEIDSLQNRLNAIDDRLQTVSIIRSNIESLPNLTS
jgi:prefoldin subunit 5